MKILKVPFSAGSLGKNLSTKDAPSTILKQSEDLCTNELGLTPYFEVIEVNTPQDNIEDTNSNIYKEVKNNLNENRIGILGGDHSITFSAFKAFKHKFSDAGLVIFDAHPECEENTDIPSHEDFLSSLINQGIIEPDEIIIVGIRNWSENQLSFLRNHNIRFFTMKQIYQNGFDQIMDTVTETARSWPNLYLSIDVDVADPAFAPGTGYCEPGGISSREFIDAIQRFTLIKNLKCFDIVEVGPEKDINNMTSKLAAKLLFELYRE